MQYILQHPTVNTNFLLQYSIVLHPLQCSEPKNEALHGSYKNGSSDTVQLSVGSSYIYFFGSGTISMNEVILKDSNHVNLFNEILLSVRHLSVGSSGKDFLGSRTISLNEENLEESIHFNELDETLLSVGHICDNGKIVAFTKPEAVILNLETFSTIGTDMVKICL